MPRLRFFNYCKAEFHCKYKKITKTKAKRVQRFFKLCTFPETWNTKTQTPQVMVVEK